MRAEPHPGTHPPGVAPRAAQAAANQPAGGAVVHVGRQLAAMAELIAAHRNHRGGMTLHTLRYTAVYDEARKAHAGDAVPPLILTLALGASDLNRGLLDGSVEIQAAGTRCLTFSSPERHWRMFRRREFDIAEVSFGAFLSIEEKTPGEFVAIPAFPPFARRRVRARNALRPPGSGRI